MRLSEAIQIYVTRRHEEGSTYINGEAVLRSLCRSIGDISLASINASQVVSFLNGSRTSANTWRGKYSMLSRFFRFWASRGAMPMLSLSSLPRAEKTFVPHIYTQAEVSALLAGVRIRQFKRQFIDAAVFRSLLLCLYSTGATVGEVLALTRADVDLESNRLVVAQRHPSRSRCIPVASDFRSHLSTFMQPRATTEVQSRLYSAVSGLPLEHGYLSQRFRRLLRVVGVKRHDSSDRLPLLQDFRPTFAVHRITDWIQKGEELNRLLPALSTYMGFSDLGAAEKFVALTPERFQRELRKLSPQFGSGRWRDDPNLMTLLRNL